MRPLSMSVLISGIAMLIPMGAASNITACVSGHFRNELGVCALCPWHHMCTNETLFPVSSFDPGLRLYSTGSSQLSDAVCIAGMFRTARTDMCKPCPLNFYCPQEAVVGVGIFTLQLPNVVRCSNNQFTYDTGSTSADDCVCLAGFKMLVDSDSVRCLACALGQRCQDGSVVEEQCHLQNKVASEDHSACVCDIGYGYSDFECVQCGPGFVKASSGDTPCLPCGDGQYAENTTTCHMCPERSDARAGSAACVCTPPYVWSVNASCELCVENFFWETTKCHACPVLSSSSPHAGMELGIGACHCASGYARTPRNVSVQGVFSRQCVACLAGQYEHAGVCTACPSGAWSPSVSTSLPPDSTQLSPCTCNFGNRDYNVEENEGNTTRVNERNNNTVLTCHTQRIDGSCAGACSDAPDLCTPCQPGNFKSLFSTTGNNETCSQCEHGAYESMYGSLECQKCPLHEWHELREQTSATACLCVAGYTRASSFRIENTTCVSCHPGHYKDWLGDTMCEKCTVGTYNPHLNSTICHMCSVATASRSLFVSALQKEAFSIEEGNMAEQGLVFFSNTTEFSGAVSVLECVCVKGHEPRDSDGSMQCESCLQGSFKSSTNHEACSYCGGYNTLDGFSLLHHYGGAITGAIDKSHCLQCPPYSGQDEMLVGPAGLRMGNITDCLCFRGHEGGAGTACTNCSLFMVQPFFSPHACTFCPAGHFFVERNVHCQMCDLAEDGGGRHTGLVVNSLDNSLLWGTEDSDCVCRLGYERRLSGMCHKCDTGKFRLSNISRNCALCPHDTFQDSTGQLECSPCPPFSHTHLQVASTSISKCVCQAGFQPLSASHLCIPCTPGTFRPRRLANETEEECLLCPPDHFCPDGAIDAIPCPAGEYSYPGSHSQEECLCPEGFGRTLLLFYDNDSLVQNDTLLMSNIENNVSTGNFTTGNFTTGNYTTKNICTRCSYGFYASKRSNDQCTPCPLFKTTISLASTNQSECVCITGHGINERHEGGAKLNASEPCHPCANGFYSHGYENKPCTSCGWGAVTFPSVAAILPDSCKCNALIGVFSSDIL